MWALSQCLSGLQSDKGGKRLPQGPIAANKGLRQKGPVILTASEKNGFQMPHVRHMCRQLPIRRRCLRWANDNIECLKNVSPDLPNVGNDRATDNWTPLFSIAELAGGQWPKLVKKAIKALEMTDDKDTIRQILLSDIRAVFEKKSIDRVSSKILVEDLVEIEDHPWGDWRRGKPITQHGLARLLKPFGIVSGTVRFEGKTPKGYYLKQFEETFKRYITHAFAPIPPKQSATTPQANTDAGLSDFQSATQENGVAFRKRPGALADGACGVVADGKGGIGEDDTKTALKSNQGVLFPDEQQDNHDAALL